jgi:Tol biopolymer transport system component
MIRKRTLALAIGLAATLALPAVVPVLASYPGATNGRIAFGQRAADGSSNVFSVNPDGTGLRQLTHGAHNHLCASYSADGRQIAYCSDVTSSWEIWSMKQNGTRQHQVTHLGGFSTFPDFSPDGSKIAFLGQIGADPSDQVYVVNSADGSGLTQLTTCPVPDGFCFNDYPVWSPDGTKIAFIHGEQFDVDGNPLDEQVWVMNANGSNKHQLTTGAAPKDQVPDWSPDGSKIAYASGGFGEGQIWVMNANGSNQHQLTGCGAADPFPCANGDDFGTAWSPDGTKIAFLRSFQALGSNNRPIYVMKADGTGQHQLIPGTRIAAVPSWQARGVGGGG